MPKHVHPGHLSRLARHVAACILALSGAKSQKEIAREAGFANANMLSMIKTGDAKLALDRVPALSKALDTDDRHLFLLAFEQQGNETALAALKQIIGTVVTSNELSWLEELRDASGGANPPLTARARKILRSLFE
ncbi:XRE family transcriptional regulator [Ponticoccus sp. (in: a-proteobacteria)]|uniref:XRE family transcriptional regulator n=1 Tax=Ponticoccus sp. (in: a-proteobacteria) TaxID=1925025 RepID=UPI003AB325BC